ncbi:MAG: N-acetyltransferase [Pedobacter sp.]|nr:MAG: N-acetyltransferase [Pedobacter sp.]
MKAFKETDRIILREIELSDAPAMFEMDSDPEVHKYLGKQPIQTINETIENIEYIRQQYLDHGIGRWAVEDKHLNQFVGWSGLKFRPDEVNGYVNYVEVGYRFLKRFWGKGYATESAIQSIDYAFEELKLNCVYAMANKDNSGSRNTLLKAGLKNTGQFNYENIDCDWFEITLEDWQKKV